MIRLKLIGCALAALVVAASHASHAQEWPNRPVKVVVPFAAAGTTDRMGRLIAEELSKSFKQQFYVENRAGGGRLHLDDRRIWAAHIRARHHRKSRL
jgi:tripartite-type tricarboxylate transporter receptor subunit TctC